MHVALSSSYQALMLSVATFILHICSSIGFILMLLQRCGLKSLQLAPKSTPVTVLGAAAAQLLVIGRSLVQFPWSACQSVLGQEHRTPKLVLMRRQPPPSVCDCVYELLQVAVDKSALKCKCFDDLQLDLMENERLDLDSEVKEVWFNLTGMSCWVL